MIPMQNIINIVFSQGTFSTVMLEFCQMFMFFHQYNFYVGNYLGGKINIIVSLKM